MNKVERDQKRRDMKHPRVRIVRVLDKNCTCHPSDNPRKYALGECRAAAAKLRLVHISRLAALDSLLDVDMGIVDKYRADYLTGRPVPPIKLRKMNKRGYYVIDDGHHRAMAALMDRRTQIAAVVSGKPFELKWRWPRCAPITMTRDLLIACGELK